MTEEYNRQTLLLEKMKNKQLETELNFLKSQYHPHFLFNALNTIYFQVDDENKNAKQTIEILSNLLRYQLYDINQKVPIQKEIDYLKTYILLLQMRASERLVVESNFDLLLKEQEIHPLLFQPLLENAFKYIGGKYFIHINLTLEGNKVVFTVKNSVNTTLQNMKTRKGIGIENLKRRLEILYPEKHSLKTELKENIFLAALVIML
jgi:LytS/YehU family sensor histidine kinase